MGALPFGVSQRDGSVELCLERSPAGWVAVLLLIGLYVPVVTGNSDTGAWIGSLSRALGFLLCTASRVLFLMHMYSRF